MMIDRKRRSPGNELACCYLEQNKNGASGVFLLSFEEEQQELQKSLSKDWCDKMDNEEAEEKKLHR